MSSLLTLSFNNSLASEKVKPERLTVPIIGNSKVPSLEIRPFLDACSEPYKFISNPSPGPKE